MDRHVSRLMGVCAKEGKQGFSLKKIQIWQVHIAVCSKYLEDRK